VEHERRCGVKYHCGHKGCDVCGARECAGMYLKTYGEYVVCEFCLNKAIGVAVRMSEEFGGTIIDPSKPCGREKKGGAT